MGRERKTKTGGAAGGPRKTVDRGKAVQSEELLTPAETISPRVRGRVSRGLSPSGHLVEAEIAAVEEKHTDGMTLAQVLATFGEHGLHLSEATFRKYVQVGLLGRSRRVGRKGKHQGSLGVYPATTVRRLNTIRQMLAANYTIEDIQRSFLRFADQIEGLRRSLAVLLEGLESELTKGRFPSERRKAIGRELSLVRKLSGEMTQRIEAVERELLSPLEREARQRTVGSGSGNDELL